MSLLVTYGLGGDSSGGSTPQNTAQPAGPYTPPTPGAMPARTAATVKGDVTLAWGGQSYVVVQGDLLLQRTGNWTAYLESIDAPSAPTGVVTILWLGTTLFGYVLRSGMSEGKLSAIIVGGNGGFWATLHAQGYDQSTPVGEILRAMAYAAGEVVSTTSTASTLSQALPQYARRAGDLGAQLDGLAQAAGAIWRVLVDGSIFFGGETWPASAAQSTDYVPQYLDPHGAWQEIAPSTLCALPGTTWTTTDGQGDTITGHIGTVVYEISSHASKARLWFQGEKASDDPLKAGIAAIAREALPGLDLLALYPCAVVLQRSAALVDVVPDSPNVPPMSNVRLVVPIPGAVLTLSGTQRGLLGFDSMDPTRPYVTTCWESGSGSKAVGRVGDAVGAATSMGTWISNVNAALLALGKTVAAPTDFGTIAAGSPTISLP